MLRFIKIGLCILIASSGSLYTTIASAAVTTVLLVRSTLSNDADADGNGLWQYEGGVVQNATGTTAIGHYIVERRVTSSGTSADNTAAERITLFFPSPTAGSVPGSITLQGAYSYNNGQFAGSVSAVSTRYRPLNGADATGSIMPPATTKLIMDLPGIYTVP